MNKKSTAILTVVIVFIVLSAPFIYTAAGNGLFNPPPKPQLTLPTEGKCIEPTEYMRANHMKLLMHTREDVVREGIRDVSHTLSNCKTCHTKRAEFCDRCHEYVGAKPECFECHYMP